MIDRIAQKVEIDSDIFGKKYIAGDTSCSSPHKERKSS
jgi:hypothetical protein